MLSTVRGRAAVQLYRKLLRVSRTLPEGKREETELEIKRRFREGVEERDEERIAELMREAESKLGFMRIVTPKRPRGQSGRRRYVMSKEEGLREGSALRQMTAMSNFREGNVDPESLARHRALTRRQYFMDRD